MFNNIRMDKEIVVGQRDNIVVRYLLYTVSQSLTPWITYDPHKSCQEWFLSSETELSPDHFQIHPTLLNKSEDVEYIHNAILCSHKKIKSCSSFITWMEQEVKNLSKISQRKNKSFMISLIYIGMNIYEHYIWAYIHTYQETNNRTGPNDKTLFLYYLTKNTKKGFW